MPPRAWEQQQGCGLRLHCRHLPGLLEAAGGSEALFWGLFSAAIDQTNGPSSSLGASSSSSSSAPADTFWLDSATAVDRGRFSFMGGRGGSLWRRIQFHLAPPPPAAGGRQQQQQQHEGEGAGSQQPQNGSLQPAAGTLNLTAADGSTEQLRTCFFDWLESLLARQRCRVR